jgi:O-antigen/teichoic acid export membrane protein
MFGVMSIVTVFAQGLSMFTEVGLWASIVRSKDGNQPHFLNTVWTLQVIRNWIIFFIILVCCAMFIYLRDVVNMPMQGVYKNPDLPVILIIIGLGSLINGHKTMAAAILSRGFERGKLELNNLLIQLSGISVMLYWAWYYPSIWALASAPVVSSIASVLLNYTSFPYRHRFSLDKDVVKEVMSFGKWILISTILTFLCMQGDRLFFAHYLSASDLGVYSIAYFLANSITMIIQQLTTKIWFPVFSKTARNNQSNLYKIYYKIRFMQDFISFFISGLLISSGSWFVSVLYDSRYAQAGWMLEYLAISIAATSVLSLGQECLSALGISKIRTKIMVVRFIGLVVGLPVGYQEFGVAGAILAVSFNSLLGIPLLFVSLYKQKLFSLLLELRLLPVIFAGYYTGKSITTYLTATYGSIF